MFVINVENYKKKLKYHIFLTFNLAYKALLLKYCLQ